MLLLSALISLLLLASIFSPDLENLLINNLGEYYIHNIFNNKNTIITSFLVIAFGLCPFIFNKELKEYIRIKKIAKYREMHNNDSIAREKKKLIYKQMMNEQLKEREIRSNMRNRKLP
jgi:hypothetical protein